MYSIYNLKHLLYQLVLDKIQETVVTLNNECTTSIDNTEQQYCKVTTHKDISIYLSIQSVKVESTDGKKYYYKIRFNLNLFFKKSYFNSNEKVVYNILEKILNLLYSMEFYYCYYINNSNIVSTFPVETTEELNTPYLTIEWVTSLNFSNDWVV